MKREHTPTTNVQARTKFVFTNEETIAALHLWLKAAGERIPKGKGYVTCGHHIAGELRMAMTIHHREWDAGATTG